MLSITTFNKKGTIYAYSAEDRNKAIDKLKGKPEITRFKGLGEISPSEFKNFINEDIKLDPIIIDKDKDISVLVGGSTSFGVGSDLDDKTIASNLSKNSDTFVYNFGGTAFNGFQEIILFLSFKTLNFD